MKVGFKGSKLYTHVFMMDISKDPEFLILIIETVIILPRVAD